MGPTLGMNRIVAMLAPCLLLLLPTASVAEALSNKWRLEFSGNARSAGTVVLEIRPVDREARRVEVSVPKGTGENKVARTVRDALRTELGDDFHVEVDDGEDVLVKRRMGRPRFGVVVVGIDVRGVRLNLDRE